MARKGILTTDLGSTSPAKPATPSAKPAPKRGAVGALQSSLTKLQESAVQDIDAELIDDAGIEDRLGIDSAAQTQLRESLKTYGQQVPVLLRPHTKKPGRFEIVYGRRRLMALKELGLPVKAMVRQLDDQDLVMAQGQENTARQDLSFIEKASFAAQLQALDYERQTIAAALSVDLPMLSRLLKAGTAFPLDFLRKIGSAPGIGRDRWLALAKLLEKPGVMARVSSFMNTPDFGGGTSDARFERAFARASKSQEPKKQPTAKPRTLRGSDGTALADIRRTGRGVTLTVSAKASLEFAGWIDSNAETLLQELHNRWQTSRSEEK